MFFQCLKNKEHVGGAFCELVHSWIIIFHFDNFVIFNHYFPKIAKILLVAIWANPNKL